MDYRVYGNAEEAGRAAAMIIASQILKKRDSVIGLATGSTPIPVYQHMIKLYNEGIVDYSRVTTFNLDEYCGLPPSHEQSYHFFMRSMLFDHINIPDAQIHLPDGMAGDLKAEGCAYDDAIERHGGIDLQLLGLGVNGHIGFNEPGDAYVFATHSTTLSESTIEANKRFFSSVDAVPRYAITMGIGTIMKARSIVLIATGKSKAESIKTMIQKDPSPICPASILQFHPDATIILDAEAASLL